MENRSKTYAIVGPWNISQGADPFARPSGEPEFAVKLREYRSSIRRRRLQTATWFGRLNVDQTRKSVAEVKKMLADEGLFAEFIAPRLWE